MIWTLKNYHANSNFIFGLKHEANSRISLSLLSGNKHLHVIGWSNKWVIADLYFFFCSVLFAGPLRLVQWPHVGCHSLLSLCVFAWFILNVCLILSLYILYYLFIKQSLVQNTTTCSHQIHSPHGLYWNISTSQHNRDKNWTQRKQRRWNMNSFENSNCFFLNFFICLKNNSVLVF